MTFNIHGGRPATGPVDLPAIAAVIRAANPDLVGLQEVAQGFPPSALFQNQPARLRSLLQREVWFSPSFGRWPFAFGNALVARASPVRRQRLRLPHSGEWKALEPRSALDARFLLEGREVRVLTTHLGLTPRQRGLQSASLAGRIAGTAEPLILMGDLNAEPGSLELRAFGAILRSCEADGAATFPAAAPRARIDHIYVSRHFEIERSWVIPTQVSDHLPLVADLVLVG
jgi:endonuclease/exonuclease/phosphatase family metal-dependent hydrolase